MYGAPVRQSYRRRGPLEGSAAVSVEEATLPDLPGTPTNAAAATAAATSDALKGTPTLQQRLQHFEALMDKAMAECERKERTRRTAQSPNPDPVPQRHDPFTVVPFTLHEERGETDAPAKADAVPSAAATPRRVMVGAETTAMGKELSSGLASPKPAPMMAWEDAGGATPSKEPPSTPARRIRVQAAETQTPEDKKNGGASVTPITAAAVTELEAVISSWSPSYADQHQISLPAPTPFRARQPSAATFRAVSSIIDDDSDEEEEEEPDTAEAVEPSAVVNEDTTDLQRAAALGDIYTMEQLIKQGADINEQDMEGRTPLMYAVQMNQMEAARLLVGKGCNISQKSCDGSTALHRAAFCVTKEMVTFLLTNGANHQIVDEDGRTALHWSAHNPNPGPLSVLTKGVKPNGINLPDGSGMTACMWAAYYGRPKHLTKLLRYGADPDLKDLSGRRALHWSVNAESTKCLELLITEIGSGLMDDTGKTVMHYAAEQDAKKAIKLIQGVRHTAVLDPDRNGRTALHYAAVCGSANAVRTLLKLGASPQAKDADGRTPIDYARESSQGACAALLAAKLEDLTEDASNAVVEDGVEQARELTGRGKKDDAVARVFQLLATGSYMDKYTNGGKGNLHRRYFWVDERTGEICWCRSPQDFFKNPDSVSAAVVVRATGAPSMAIRTRKDFELDGKHKYSITIRTTTRSLDLVAPSEALYRLWVDGLRCYLAYGEALLSEESVQTNAGDDKGKSDVKRSTEASPQ